MPSVKRPHKVTITVFDVGFGDCFLLKFHYADKKDERRILIDFGSTKWRKEKGATALQIAKDIADACTLDKKSKLPILVATHRHADHISGFATNKGKGSGDIIAALDPELVIQPWTEEPGLSAKATAPAANGHHAFAKQLANMERVAQSLTGSMKHLRMGKSNAVVNEIKFIGLDNISNKSAIENLARMGRKRQAKYVHADMKLSLGKLLPGVKVHVLGPPTIDQWSAVTKMTSKNPIEFWHLQNAFWTQQASNTETGAPELSKALEGEHATMAGLPIYSRWFVQQMRSMQVDMARGIVRRLDDQMNNTSVILLFEVNGKKLLFPGDAQWENWQYALSKPAYQKLLRDVDVYKVGHHGSLNATPKESLWGKFSKAKGKSGGMMTLLSTLHGKHGHDSDKTEVPRSTLVSELRKKTKLTDTEDFPASDRSQVVEVNLT